MRILDLIGAMFKRQTTPEIIIDPPKSHWTPEIIERMIEDAGRAEVFAEAERMGWSRYDCAPLWVWGQICCRVQAAKRHRLNTGPVIEHKVH